MKTRPVQIVCVVNNLDIFNKAFKDNACISRLPVHRYDNTTENVGIAQRYNHFIQQYMHDDSWVIFCHQDFRFLEDPRIRLRGLDPNYIYGPIGAARKKGIFIRNSRITFERKILLGQIDQARGDSTFSKDGIFLSRPRQVDTLDCCCIIVHASLIRKYKLRFDERFSFHLYAEDFSLNARYTHGIETRALQIQCQHLSTGGDVNSDFRDLLAYLKSKYKGKYFVGTCF